MLKYNKIKILVALIVLIFGTIPIVLANNQTEGLPALPPGIPPLPEGISKDSLPSIYNQIIEHYQTPNQTKTEPDNGIVYRGNLSVDAIPSEEINKIEPVAKKDPFLGYPVRDMIIIRVNKTASENETGINIVNRRVTPSKPKQEGIIKTEIKVDAGTGQEIEVESDKGRIWLTSNNVKANTNNDLKIENSKLYMISEGKEVEVKLLPDVIDNIVKENIGIISIEDIKLKASGESSMYEIRGIKKGKLFAIIPIDVSTSATVNAETGEIEGVKEPWWGVLVR